MRVLVLACLAAFHAVAAVAAELTIRVTNIQE